MIRKQCTIEITYDLPYDGEGQETITHQSESPVMIQEGDIFIDYGSRDKKPFKILVVEEYYIGNYEDQNFFYDLSVEPVNMFLVWFKNLFDPSFDIIQFGG